MVHRHLRHRTTLTRKKRPRESRLGGFSLRPPQHVPRPDWRDVGPAPHHRLGKKSTRGCLPTLDSRYSLSSPRLGDRVNLIDLVTRTGIVLSQFEPSALIQFEGGPCAILAPVQAFLLRNLLKQWKSQEWKTVRAVSRRSIQDLVC